MGGSRRRPERSILCRGAVPTLTNTLGLLEKERGGDRERERDRQGESFTVASDSTHPYTSPPTRLHHPYKSVLYRGTLLTLTKASSYWRDGEERERVS